MKRGILANLVVLLVTAAVASAVTTVTLVPIEEGEPGSVTNPLEPSDDVLVLVTSDGGLLGLDCILTITSGPATIVDAMCGCDWWIACPWDTPCFGPPIEPDGKRAETCGAAFGAPASGIVGWFVLHCDGPGAVTVELTPGMGCGGSMDYDFQVPTITGSMTIHQLSEATCWDDTECPCQTRGDATCDGGLNLADLFALKAAFGRSAPWVADHCCADFNRDDRVDLADMYILRGWPICFDPPGPSTGNQNCPP
ncbi:MAG: hypothetical protein ACYS21_15990 [Planctomycetota bacterium]